MRSWFPATKRYQRYCPMPHGQGTNGPFSAAPAPVARAAWPATSAAGPVGELPLSKHDLDLHRAAE